VNADKITEENARRNKELKKPYDPVTGEGCTGDRVCLKINDAPCPVLYLPMEMMREEVCRLLAVNGFISELFKLSKERQTKELFEDFWICFCELRYRYDFEFFAFNCVVIRDKVSSKDIPFRLNRGQRKLLLSLEKMRLDNVPIRIMVLKARQWGGSTLIQIYMLWIQLIHKKNWNSVICAHVRDASITIRAMFERAIKDMIPISSVKHTIKNYQGTQNIKEVPERGCLITVGTAIEPDSVRSQDVKMAHFSEVALYPNTEANKTENLETSIVGSIPSEPLTLIARESTANGVGDFFYEEWGKAKEGKTVYEAVFIEWFLIDIYRREFNGKYYLSNGKQKKGTIEEFAASLTEYELNLFNNHEKCTLENLNWRRFKRAEMTSEAKMKQEFPSDDIEAFQDSGLPAFRSEDVDALRKHCRRPLAIGTLVSDGIPSLSKMESRRRRDIFRNIHFVDEPGILEDINTPDVKVRERKERDKLRIWDFPDTETRISNRYITVFDPQKGLSENADWGVVAVLDRYWMMFGGKPEIVAEWRGRIDKDIAIWVAAQIAAFYNNSLLVVESNTYDTDITKEDDSEFIFDTIAEYYPNLYSRTPADKIREGIPVKYGFNTNRNTKPMIINNYVAILREGSYIERNEEALGEARVYEQKKNGSFGAKEGKHDDILMTRMIGLHICFNELPLPVLTDSEARYLPEKPVGESSI
jgi:hypothetical protein